MEHFLKIMTKADNIPIAIMFVIVLFITVYTLVVGLRNDKLIKEGKMDEVIKRMNE